MKLFKNAGAVLALLLCFNGALFSQIITQTDPRPVEVAFHNVIGQYWKVLEARNLSDMKELNHSMKVFEQCRNKFRDRMIRSLRSGDSEIRVFRRLVNELPDYTYSAFTSVIDSINECILAGGELFKSKVPTFLKRSPERTEYIYRLGREIKRELIKAEWVIFRKTIMKNVKVSMVVEADVAKMLKALYPVLFLLDLGSWLINGEAYFCYRTTFTTEHKLFFRTVAKIGKNKVWFEVLRAKKTWWGSPEWSKYGETYRIIEEPTGEELASEMRVLD